MTLEHAIIITEPKEGYFTVEYGDLIADKMTLDEATGCVVSLSFVKRKRPLFLMTREGHRRREELHYKRMAENNILENQS